MVGFWRTELAESLPEPSDLVDATWEANGRTAIADYLERGFIARAYLGRSTCRLCGSTLGSLTLTDGTYCWPEGLGHYVAEHAVRLPEDFLGHVRERAIALEGAAQGDEWWKSAVGGQ
jgi:hypothetical protein